MTNIQGTYEITVTHKITTEDLKDILCGAFEGGSNYWIAETRLCGWKHVGPNNYRCECKDAEHLRAEFFHEIPALGGVLQVRELDSSCLWHNLTTNALLRGISRAAQEGRINPGVEEWTCDVDGDVADVILQYALLGELVYG